MKRLFSGDKSPKKEKPLPPPQQYSSTALSPSSPFSNQNDNTVSPELSPIVTLLSAQSHRRYNEGVFMLLNDLTSDGKPGDRKWEELYGVLTGTQLAIWDANKLSQYKDDPEKLISTSSKPTYINFTDSSFNAVDTLPSSSGDLHNVIIVSTTLKNRFLLQYASKKDFNQWYAAFRLATFEYTCLQEAYTGALLSARGSRLSDIRVVLAESKYDHEEWVSVRFGSGMPWKRCFAVIEPSPKKSKKKFHPGKIIFYENEKKSKKTAMASIVSATTCYTIYPQKPQLIDHSTLIKLEGTISFHKNDTKEASVFLMPEQHFSVPGFDTVIRFLVPTLDAFGLYGRPKKLIADKNDPKSLLFGLPVLPHVHYLELEDILPIASQPSVTNMTVEDWFSAIKSLLLHKLSAGYSGCGSVNGIEGAMSSLTLTNSDQSSSLDDFIKPPNKQISPLTPSFLPTPDMNSSRSRFGDNHSSKSSLSSPEERSAKSVRNSGRLSEIYNKYSQIDAPSNSYHGVQETSLSSLSLDKSKSKLSIDDDDDDFASQVKTPKNIFDPSFGDKDFNDDISPLDSTDSLDFVDPSRKDGLSPPDITKAIPAYEKPSTINRDDDFNLGQRVLSPYSSFHQQVNQTIGITKPSQPSKTLVYSQNNNNIDDDSGIRNKAPLPTPPSSNQLQQPYQQKHDEYDNRLQQPPQLLPKTRQQPTQPFEQRAPSDNIVPQQLKVTQPLQQQPMRNLTPNGSYQQLPNPYNSQPRQVSPAVGQFVDNRSSPVPSPAHDSFTASNNNPYVQARSHVGQPQQQQQQQQYRRPPQQGPQGSRPQQPPMQGQAKQLPYPTSDPTMQGQHNQRPYPQQQQYPHQQQYLPPPQQQYPRQQQYLQSPQQRPPQQQPYPRPQQQQQQQQQPQQQQQRPQQPYPQQRQNYPNQPQQVPMGYPPQQSYPPQQQQPNQQRPRKAPPQQVPQQQQIGNPYNGNNQYF